MEKSIREIAAQFSFEPVIENQSALKEASGFVCAGMGGSHLSAGILKIINPALDLYIHRDYGLPSPNSDWFKKSMYIASSYSGNTEETIDFAHKAHEAGYNLAIVSTGGKLIEFAKKNGIPYILLPQTNIQPRVALGFSLLALAKLTLGDDVVRELQTVGLKIDPLRWKEVGESLAEKLKTKVPVIYASTMNFTLAYNWKITLNETAKIPAFFNVVPELNHNEMNGFDATKDTKALSKDFHFIFLQDPMEHPGIMRRMEVMKKIYEDRGLHVRVIELVGESTLEKVFNSVILAAWTSLSLSTIYGTEPEQVPVIEEFKKLIS